MLKHARRMLLDGAARTFSRYAWPVVATMLFQGLLFLIPPMQTPDGRAAIPCFVVIDLLLVAGQVWEFRSRRKFERELESIERDLPDGLTRAIGSTEQTQERPANNSKENC